MQITKISEHIGAEIVGIDLRQPVDEETRQRLNKAVVDNVAVVIRNQQLTPEQFLEVAKLFGTPMTSNNPQFAVPDMPLVSRLSNFNQDSTGKRVKVGSSWHTDHTNHEYPPKYTLLYAVELPDSGGDTRVCNTRAGYAALPEALKRQLDGMKTVNVRVGSAVTDKHNTIAMEAQARLKPAPVLQPLVRTNPENGTKALYFNPIKTENIVGMSPEESQALLHDLTSQLLRPEFIYRHRWRLGDVFLWDNRAALHQAGTDYDSNQHRLMYRAMVRGERPR